MAKIYLEALQDFTQSTKGEVRGFQTMNERKKDKKRGDGKKNCGQRPMSKDGGITMQLLVVGHPFDKVDSWQGGPILE